MDIFSELSLVTWFAILGFAFLSGFVHGATGMAGGILMTTMLSHVIGIKDSVIVMTAALVISHSSRVVIYRQHTDWQLVKKVLFFGWPAIVLGAIIFSYLNDKVIASVFALFLISSFPIKNWANRNKLKTGPRLLAAASSVWGILAGNVIGPSFFLAPFLLGVGINRLVFVGTLASITLIMNLTKLAVFGTTDLLNGTWLALGGIIGCCSIPGNWLGKKVLHALTDEIHRKIIDIFTILMILNFSYLAIS